MATGFARGAADRGKRVAFGDKTRIIWGPWSADIFRGNPNIAPPGTERTGDIEWVPYYKGHRIYNRQGDGKWIWNYKFRPVPGELFFDRAELEFAASLESGFILIEPNVSVKTGSANKDWGFARYQAVADRLRTDGHRVAQFQHGPQRLHGVEVIAASTFRRALAALSRAKLAILPEGGLHHGAAAVGVPAVVIFGGWIPPAVTGYQSHTNLTGDANEACGSFRPCSHCRIALNAISIDEVLSKVMERLMVKKLGAKILQDISEFDRFVDMMRSENIRSYLEIGSKHGGSLWRMATHMPMPPGSRIVSVDLPHGDQSFKDSEPNLDMHINELNRRGYDAYLLIGDSTDPAVIEDVRKLGPFDLTFIDANHTEPFVRADWQNYGPMSRIVAFHDIGWIPRPEPSKKMPIDVPKIWNEINPGFRYKEIRHCPRDNGIGILWRLQPTS